MRVLSLNKGIYSTDYFKKSCFNQKFNEKMSFFLKKKERKNAFFYEKTLNIRTTIVQIVRKKLNNSLNPFFR